MIITASRLFQMQNPFGEVEEEIISPVDGIIIGRSNLPLVNESETLFYKAKFKRSGSVAD